MIARIWPVQFSNLFVQVHWLWERVALRQSERVPCWFSWAVLAVWPVVVTLGLFTQTIVTGRGIHHQESKSRGFLVTLIMQQQLE